MTKRQAVSEFAKALKTDKPNIALNDKPAIREAWGRYTDILCKGGQISSKQYHTWPSPY